MNMTRNPDARVHIIGFKSDKKTIERIKQNARDAGISVSLYLYQIIKSAL